MKFLRGDYCRAKTGKNRIISSERMDQIQTGEAHAFLGGLWGSREWTQAGHPTCGSIKEEGQFLH